MRKKFYLFLLILILLVPVVNATITIEIDIKDSFSLGETIIFNYNIVSDTGRSISYTPYVSCPNAPSAMLSPIPVDLEANVPLSREFSDFTIYENIEPQTCTAYVEIYEPLEKTASKSFKIETIPSFLFNIKICKDSRCKEDSKVFIQNEDIYLDYESDVLKPIVTAILTYPDKTTKKLTLPISIKSDEIGTHILKVTAEKENYKTVKKIEQFAVIEGEVDIEESVFIEEPTTAIVSKDVDYKEVETIEKQEKSKIIEYFLENRVTFTIVLIILAFVLLMLYIFYAMSKKEE